MGFPVGATAGIAIGVGVLGAGAITMLTPNDKQLNQTSEHRSHFSREDALGTFIGGGVILALLGIPGGILGNDHIAGAMIGMGLGAAVGGMLGGIGAGLVDSRSAVKQLPSPAATRTPTAAAPGQY